MSLRSTDPGCALSTAPLFEDCLVGPHDVPAPHLHCHWSLSTSSGRPGVGVWVGPGKKLLMHMTCSFHKYVLRACHVLGSVSGSEATAENEHTDGSLCLRSFSHQDSVGHKGCLALHQEVN